MASKRVLIVGGVAGGASCAARLRRLDEEAEIFLYQRSADISFATCGLPYYLGRVITDRQHLLVATPERFRDMFRVEVRTRSEVRRIDRQAKTIEVANVLTGDTVRERYDALVLSPGARPILPNVPGIDLPGVFSLRDLDDMDRIDDWVEHRKAERAVVVGGGFIGLEMAENLSRRGLDVVLLEVLDQVLTPLDPEMAAPLHAELRAKGVDLQVRNGVAAIKEGPGDLLTVVAQSNDRFSTDLVIVAVGVKPDVRLAEEAGLELGPTGGIKVDEQMRTSDPAIWAVGDAVEVRDFVTAQPVLLPLAGPASRQGRIAAAAICGRDDRFRGTQGTMVVGVFDMTAAATGASEKSLRRANMPFEKSYTYADHHAGYYPGARRIAMKLLFEPTNGRILGAQAVGKAGVDKRIDVLAMAIQKGATVFDLEEADLCYAPQYGSAKDPVNIAGFVAGNVLRGDVELAHWDDWLRRRADSEETPLVLDVRPPGIIATTGTVPGSVKIPLSELRVRLGELPRDKEIWIYCAVGQTSYFAARILKQHGFRVRNFSGGFLAYKAAGGK